MGKRRALIYFEMEQLKMQTTIRSVIEEEIECRRKRIDHLLELEENGAAARESAVLEGLMIALTRLHNKCNI